MSYETDPRHVDIVVKTLGVTKPVTTPLVRESPGDVDIKDKPLSDEEAAIYRSCTLVTEDWIYCPRPYRPSESHSRTCQRDVVADRETL